MVEVRMQVQISGTRNGVDWPARGGTLDVPEGEAKDLIANGMAVAAGAPEEKAVVTAQTEKAVVPKSGNRPVRSPRQKAPAAPKKAAAPAAEAKAAPVVEGAGE